MAYKEYTELGSFGMNDIINLMYNIDKGKTYPIRELKRIEDLIFNETNRN